MRRPLVIASLCVLAGVVVYLVATRVPAVAAADVRTLEGFMGLWSLHGAGQAYRLVSLFDPQRYVLLVLGIVAAATLMGRTRIGLLAGAMMICAGLTSQVLKTVLAVQRDFPPGHSLGPEAWPSGHTTGAMSFALALVLIAPPKQRALAAAAGGVLTVASTYGILINGFHYPSDVLGGLLVATFWASLAVIPLRGHERVSLRAPVMAGGVLAAVALLTVLSRPEAAASYAEANTTFVAGALVIALATLVLSGSVLAPTAAPPRPPLGSRPARG